MTRSQMLAKDVLDRLVAFVLLVASLPLLVVAAAWIKFCSRGPLLFVQQRVGLHEQPFAIYKLRTMKVGSEAHVFGCVTTRDDPRLIRGGGLLRKWKIDELPQLLNVLSGAMSLVGPRPTVEADYARMTPRQRRRAAVKPGLTGLAQINGAAALPWPRRIEFDLIYIRDRSIWLDLRILLATLGAVLSGKADQNPPCADEWADGPHGEPPYAERRIYLSPPHLSARERELLLDALDSNWIAPLGPHVDAFEREFAETLGVSQAVALSSGTAALHLALLVAGVRAGDTVLTSTLTFAATANAIRYVGAEPVFIDSEPATWNLDPQLLEEELLSASSRGRLPKAVLVVDVCGQCADWDAIRTLCRRYDITAIEDAAESLGATYRGRPAGTLADVGCFSFNGNKIITTSGGGMLISENPDWAERVRHLASQARDPAPHYEHSQIGYNYRLSNLLAAVGRGQLEVLDNRVAKRRANYDFYRHALADVPGIAFMPEAPFGRATRWLTCLLIEPDRFGVTPAKVCAAMAAVGIEARPMWKPMHQQPAHASCRVRGGQVADEIFSRGLCLPSGSNLSERQLQRVVDAFRAALGLAGNRCAA